MASNNKSSADSSTNHLQNTRPPRQVSSRSSNVSDLTTDEERPIIKKIPPIKAPVGLAKAPDLKNCKSKVGSLNNIKHAPTSSGISIQSQKLKWDAKSKVGSLENKAHKPGGGNRKVETQKLEWKTTSRVQSLQNVNHKPGGGNVKIFNESYMNKTSNDRKQNITSDEKAESGPTSTRHPADKNNVSVDTDGLGKNLQDLKI